MASIYHLFENVENIIPQIIERDQIAQDDRKIAYISDLKVKRAWSDHLRINETIQLNHAATVIQKYVRGWLVRWNLPKYYRSYVNRIRAKFYNDKAAVIQKAWRSYKLRKENELLPAEEKKSRHDKTGKHLNKRSRGEDEEKNRLAKEPNRRYSKTGKHSVADGQEILQEFEKDDGEKDAKELVLFILFKLHHLVRTAATEGIFSIHGKRELSYLEKLLKFLPMKGYMKKLRAHYYHLVKKIEQIPEEPRKFKGWLGRYEIMYRSRDRTRELKEPPLPFYSIEHDKPFNLSTRLPKTRYERQLLTQEKFCTFRKYVARSENPEQNLSNHDFDLNTTKISPIKEKLPAYHINFWSRFCELHSGNLSYP